MARIQRLQIAGAAGVPMGQAGTGEAVMFKPSTFDPVKWAEDNRKYAELEKIRKDNERKAFNTSLLNQLEPTVKGAYYRQPVVSAFSELRNTYGSPDKIQYLIEGNNPVANEFQRQKTAAMEMNVAQSALSDLIESELALSQKYPEKFDPKSVEELRALATERIPLDKAVSFIKERGGTVLRPAYDIEDLVKQVNYVPDSYEVKRSGSRELYTPRIDDQKLNEAIDNVLHFGGNAPAVDYLTGVAGDEERLRKTIKDRMSFKEQTNMIPKTSSGGGDSDYQRNSVGVVSKDWSLVSNSEAKQGGPDFFRLSYKSKNPEPFNYYDDNGNEIFMTPDRIEKRGESYVLKGREMGRKQEKQVNKDDTSGITSLLNQGYTKQGVNPSNPSEDIYVKFEELRPVDVYLNDNNSTSFLAQTGINFWDEAKRLGWGKQRWLTDKRLVTK
jgi:hypothetical protein